MDGDGLPRLSLEQEALVHRFLYEVWGPCGDGVVYEVREIGEKGARRRTHAYIAMTD